MDRLQRLLRDAGVRTETEYPLAPRSSFRIGGAARLAVFPTDRGQMLTALRFVVDSNLPYAVIGNASNVVFSDGGFDGVVLFTGAFKQVTREGQYLICCAGATLASLARTACAASLSGLEFAHGIPGTVGGAIFMNAGAYGGCMADICVCSEYFDAEHGEVRCLTGEAQGFGIRTSIYEKNPHDTVLSATLRLEVDDPRSIEAKMREFAKRRHQSQPLEFPSAGSVFKRPHGYFAGKLIEDCGLKGSRVGGAEVSEKHAGFIVNRGGATAEDVRLLVERIQTTVLAQTGVALEPEIRFL